MPEGFARSWVAVSAGGRCRCRSPLQNHFGSANCSEMMLWMHEPVHLTMTMGRKACCLDLVQQDWCIWFVTKRSVSVMSTSLGNSRIYLSAQRHHLCTSLLVLLLLMLPDNALVVLPYLFSYIPWRLPSGPGPLCCASSTPSRK